MNAGSSLGPCVWLQCSVHEHHEGVEGLVVEPHDEGVQRIRAPHGGAETSKEGRTVDGGGLAWGGGGAG